MLTSPGWRGRQSQRQAFGGFIGGLFAGALTAACALWVLGGLASVVPAWAASTLVGVATAGGLLHEFSIHRFRLPENRRLVPIEVFDRQPVLAGAQFGYELGTGVRTYLPSATPYVLAAGVVLIGDSGLVAALAGAGFASGRALMPISRSLASDTEEWDLKLARAVNTVGRSSMLLVAAGILAVTMR